MATWPGSLPQEPIYQGYQETSPDLVVSTQMDDGAPKRRKYTTANTYPIQMRFFMTDTQKATHDTFFQTTVNGGADSFTFTDPITSSSITVAYMIPEGKPKYTFIGGDGTTKYFHCDVIFEVLP